MRWDIYKFLERFETFEVQLGVAFARVIPWTVQIVFSNCHYCEDGGNCGAFVLWVLFACFYSSYLIKATIYYTCARVDLVCWEYFSYLAVSVFCWEYMNVLYGCAVLCCACMQGRTEWIFCGLVHTANVNYLGIALPYSNEFLDGCYFQKKRSMGTSTLDIFL